MSQNTLSLPHDVCQLLQTYYTCEMTTVNRVGQPITWPCLAYFHAETGHIIVTASIAFRVKALNARRHPQVSLLYSDPSGSGLSTPPALLVQGIAHVQELVDYTDPEIIGLFRVIQERQPASKKFSTRLMRRMFTWYLYQRFVMIITPERIRLWPQGGFHAEATEIEVTHVE
ncbi:MAG: pyridoxamine 5'-phosphate oxidase family protein [Ktedonobacteraceae bacterium]